MTPIRFMWQRKAESGDIDIMASLITAGAIVDRIEQCGRTALHTVAIKGSPAMIHILLDAGADINMGDARGFTPLHEAVRYQKLPTARALLERNASIKANIDLGGTPIDFAFRSVEMVKLLVEFGADVNSINDRDGLLHNACSIGNSGLVAYLIQLGVKLDAVNNKNETAISCAYQQNHHNIVEMLVDAGVILTADERNKCDDLKARMRDMFTM